MFSLLLISQRLQNNLNELSGLCEWLLDQHKGVLAQQMKPIFIPHRLEAVPPTVLFSAAPLMYYSTHVTRCLVLIPCCQVVGEADREEHPPVWHAGGSGQSGGSDCSERREKRLGGQQSLGEGLPGQCKTHTWTKHKQSGVWVLLSPNNMHFHVLSMICHTSGDYSWYLLYIKHIPVKHRDSFLIVRRHICVEISLTQGFSL